MANFNLEIEKVLKREGGYVDHENDRGGATNLGITIGTLSRWRGKKVSKTDVKNLTKDEAEKIYKAYYWNPVRASEIKSQLVAGLLFDQAVNRGPKTAARNLQEAFNSISEKKIKVDGIIGQGSLKAFNDIDSALLSVAYFKDIQLDYVDIVKRNPSQIVFLKGWIGARTHSLLDTIISSFSTDTVEEEEQGWFIKLLKEFYDFYIDAQGNPKEKPKTLKEKILFHNPTIEAHEIERALKFLPKAENKTSMLYVDFDLHDMDKRAYLIDLATGKAERFKTSHGASSDKDKDGYPESFSNVPQSRQSSLGAMVSGEEYGKSIGGYSKFKNARKLHGLEPFNSKVEPRAIVLHNASYVSHGGDSWGCLAFENSVAPYIIDQLKDGTLIYINHKSLS